MTEIILLERVENLGKMGDVVRVKPGFARNFLIPQKKALRATKANVAYFETQRKALEAQNQKFKGEAEAQAKKIEGAKLVIIRQAAEGGQLFGSVSARDVADAANAKGFKIERKQVALNQAFKTIGLFPVPVYLHPEVKVDVILNIARSEEEAKTQEKIGKALIAEEPNKKAAMKAEEKAEEAPAETPAEEAAA
ncbi:MAG: 50S ribosomal protein L9 [Alphaproteobacteria bacterium]|nr:50S ribosomal protein L9 [Alphaproteobacteria bacterium]